MKKTFNHSREKGFTLIETLIAISILVIAIFGSFTAVQTGLSSSILSKNGIVAFYLAQEGVEEIRNIRDENGLRGQSWLTGISGSSGDPCYFGKSCIVDAPANTVSSCSGGPDTCSTIRQDPVNGFYGYNASWTLTPFTRSITLTSINSNEVALTVQVVWSKNGVSRTYKVRENILNWQ